MSFKNFSLAHDPSGKDKPEEKTKTAPVVDQPAAQPDKPQDEAAPVQKS